MATPAVVVLGGGLSGMATAYALARAGKSVVLLERAGELGGLAGTFEMNGHFYPLAYHHILHRDRTLLYFLNAIGALDRVRWRQIRMLFRTAGKLYDLSNPAHFLRFPMSLADKARFARMMLRAFRKSDWSDWNSRSAAELVDSWAGPGVRRALFEPLCRLKFDLPAVEVSGAWLGARLFFREGSAPLGYIPGHNWTKVLVDGVTRLLEREGVEIRLGETAVRLESAAGRAARVGLADGRTVAGDAFVSTVPTEIYRAIAPEDATPELAGIRYTAVVSAICATRQKVEPNFYWMNLASPRQTASGIFMLNALNPTIGAPGDACVNFVTHVPSRDSEFFRRTETELLQGYLEDFEAVFGFALRPFWTRVSRLPIYSPVFSRGYHNPPPRSADLENVYFAGNYRTFPSIASTGTALRSGIDAAAEVLGREGSQSDLPEAIDRYRPTSVPGA